MEPLKIKKSWTPTATQWTFAVPGDTIRLKGLLSEPSV
jgi:hypothetical protein